jgi:hypothetical protein
MGIKTYMLPGLVSPPCNITAPQHQPLVLPLSKFRKIQMSPVFAIPRSKACRNCAAAKVKCEPAIGYAKCKRYVLGALRTTGTLADSLDATIKVLHAYRKLPSRGSGRGMPRLRTLGTSRSCQTL